MMDMQAKNQYLLTLIQERGYHLRTKKEKTGLLNEYCENTSQNRNYVIRKINTGAYLKTRTQRKKKKEYYDGYVREALVKLWGIFDYPCGQRLEASLKEVGLIERLRRFKELNCSDEVAMKLKKIDSSTIDEKLKHQKEVEHLKRKYHQKRSPLLYQKIPVKLSNEQDRNGLGNIQTDLVEHCGQSARGEYLCTISNTDIASGWWEGEAIIGRGQIATQQGLERARKRFPFVWREIHSDNGVEFINAHLFRYTQQQGFAFSRSRPNKKNDNCLVEQKNWTHVKKYLGYHRYDTSSELNAINSLYQNELRLYKNFFQPIIKLVSKEKIGGHLRRRYDFPKTPYQRTMESNQIDEKKKRELKTIYESLNPAELKRRIDQKLNLLYKVYQKKNHSQKVEIEKKIKPSILTFYIRERGKVHLPS